MTNPRATYRVQFHPGFGFEQAAQLADYLAELGISHLYCSPYLQSAPGSQHGYDVVDPRRVNSELGGEHAYARMCAELERHQLAQLLDIVPNHMAIGGTGNHWWWDVLENGPSSHYASYFDVDWEPPEARLRNSVLLPVLGAQYGRALEAGEIQIARERDAFVIRYYNHRFPMAPRSLAPLFDAGAAAADSDQLGFIADALVQLPLPTALDRQSLARRHRDKAVIERLVARTLREHPAIAAAVDRVIAETNADHAALHALLERQNYRLAFWRAAGRDLGYRRFFDINTLVGLRMEDPQVFADTHELVLQWLASGVLAGLRVDHIDGLRDPEQYLQRLRAASPGAWLVVEKILQPGEHLPESWPIDGTTGYDFVNRAGGLLVDPAGEIPLTRLYEEFAGEQGDFAALELEKRELIMSEVLGSDLNRLTAMFVDICEQHPRYRDYSRHELHEALKAMAMRLPVYRTYLSTAQERPPAQDEHYLDQTTSAVKRKRTDLDPELLDFLHDILLLRAGGRLETELALRFQQFTGSVMAKAVEDTAFYCFNRFICLNEVGGQPTRFGTTPQEFHRECHETQRRWPRTMLASSTHDTKRSEDVRARLALLSEIPDQWQSAVRRWSSMNQPHWNGAVPDRNLEYLLYQTLVGAWPITRERVLRYLEKAMREAKHHTSWTKPNRPYEQAMSRFVDNLFGDREFLRELERFIAPLIEPGRVNSLALVLLKMTAPGVPDFYQGCELWDLSLVDPDNRRPVDYQSRRRRLAQVKSSSLEQIMRGMDEALPKLWTIYQALGLRRRDPEAFGPGSGVYTPLEAQGQRAAHLIAFCRAGRVITVAPRFPLKLGGDWGDTSLALPSGNWRNEFTAECVTGGRTAVAMLTARFPVCLLSREAEP